MKNNKHINILIIDNHLNIPQDFMEMICAQNQSHNQFNILENQIFGSLNHRSTIANFNVTIVHNEREAIGIITNKAIKFAITFLNFDISLGINGIETAKIIWKIDPNMQIVVFFNNYDCHLEKSFSDLKLNNNLLIYPKPFRSITSIQMILILAEKWLNIQEAKNYNSIIENYVQERTEELIYKANHDPLTKLGNRDELATQLANLINIAENNKLKFGLFYFDLDNFKFINDHYSHEIGDQVLQKISKRIANSIRTQDLVFRIGGDEFVILIPGVKNNMDLKSIGKHLLKITQEPIAINNLSINTKISIGIVMFPKHGKDLLHKADLAMYKAKSLGGNQFFMFDN